MRGNKDFKGGGGGGGQRCGVGTLKWGAETPLQTMSYTQIEI